MIKHVPSRLEVGGEIFEHVFQFTINKYVLNIFKFFETSLSFFGGILYFGVKINKNQ